MKALLVEDETAAAVNLIALLHEVDPNVMVVATLESVTDTIRWLSDHAQPDLIFMDIHLADGDAFKIFERIDVVSPVVFTTAYDKYALEAFKVNSIDYLLKPIKRNDLIRALDKFRRLSGSEKNVYVEQTRKLFSGGVQHFLIPYRDKLVPVNPSEIAFFYTTDEHVSLTTLDQRTLPMDRSLDTLMEQLPARDFYRANRQYIVSRQAVADLSVWFGHRLSLNLSVPTPERIIISKARVPDFKRWFTGSE